MIAVSMPRYAPVIMLVPGPLLSQVTMPLYPAPPPLFDMPARPLICPAATRKLAPFRLAPMYPPPAAKNAVSRARAVGWVVPGQAPVLKTTS